MAKSKRKKKNKKQRRTKKPMYNTVRDWAAVFAHFATGGGKHKDRRTKRNRTRLNQKRNAIKDGWDE